MKLPVIIVNFKVYEEASGENALALAKIHERVAKETGASIAIAVNAIDIVNIVGMVDIPVFAQHVDYIGYGSGTGKIVPEHLKQAGVYGTLLNHAEYPVSDEHLKKAITKCKELGLFVVACAPTPEKGKSIAKMGPDLVAIEPPELIGGDISIAKAEPFIVKNSVDLIGRGKVLVGAGVKTGEDVRLACELGASGVLLASGITKSNDPYTVLMDLVSGLNL